MANSAEGSSIMLSSEATFSGSGVLSGFSSNLITSLLGLHSLLQSSSAVTLLFTQISGMNSRRHHTLFKMLSSSWSYFRIQYSICLLYTKRFFYFVCSGHC